jgi:hypothetical protein
MKQPDLEYGGKIEKETYLLFMVLNVIDSLIIAYQGILLKICLFIVSYSAT